MYPVLLQVGPLGLRTLGVAWIIGIYAGSRLAVAEFRRRGLEPDGVHDVLTAVVVAGLIGARLLYVLLFDPTWLVAHPRELVSIWSGLAFHGALLGGWSVALWFCRRRGIGFWRFADAAIPGLVLGQAVGAIGSFLNGSGYGTPAGVAWAVTFHDPRGQGPLGVPVHPTQLYEALALAILLGLVWAARSVRRDGALLLLYLAGLLALAPLEWLKGDALWLGEVVPAALPLSLAAVLITGAAWVRAGWRPAEAAAGDPAPRRPPPAESRR